MNPPLPPPNLDVLPEAARWCALAAEALADAGRRVGRLAEQIACDWPDDRGREWAERSRRLRRELDRDAAAAAELGKAFAHDAVDPGHGEPVMPLLSGVRAGRGAAQHTGMRLGGTDGGRVDDEPGMRIAELPEQGTTPS